METIKNLRKNKGLTQVAASEITKIPLRTFKMYENDASKIGTIKYNYIIQELSNYGYIDEEHGIISLEDIIFACEEVFEKHDVEYAILFGSYAKGIATDRSDVDLIVSTSVTGLKFYGMVEELRVALRKKVDLLDLNQLSGNRELLNEVLKDGIRVYGKN